MGRAHVLALVVGLAGLASAGPAASAQALDMSPNLPGVWTPDAGVIHFHVLHRFQVLDAPSRKVVNTPTMLLAAGVADGLAIAGRYATSSLLVPGEPNEWEAYTRWAPVREDVVGLDAAVRAGWNGTAESVDGEVVVARGIGPVRLQLAGRAFSAWRGGGAEYAVAGGAVWRLHRWVALAADAAQLLDGGAEAGWSAGLQLRIPYTPHTLSLHASNVNATTLQSSTVAVTDRTLWGFEFTVPLTLSRYFGGRESAASAAGAGPAGARPPGAVGSPASAATDTVVVAMDNRLRFLPDTVRIKAGGVVRWENTSDVVHTVTADPSLAAEPSNVQLPQGAATFDSGDLVPGAIFVREFSVPGVYQYVCLPHELAGMVGTVIVEE